MKVIEVQLQLLLNNLFRRMLYMKNIIIIGASRAGKCTLTKLLSNKINNIMIIETDILRLAFRDTIVKDTTIHTAPSRG